MNGCERNARYVNGMIEVMVMCPLCDFVCGCINARSRKIDKNTTRHRCDCEPDRTLYYLEMVDSTMNIGDNFYIGIVDNFAYCFSRQISSHHSHMLLRCYAMPLNNFAPKMVPRVASFANGATCRFCSGQSGWAVECC